MSTETMSIFSPHLAARLDELVTRYPVRRSALVPMLLYTQDEIGYLSDAVVEEVAYRIGITVLEVRNVATYYSMLRFKPVGKYNVQVCTNISCMLRGAYDLFDHLQDRLGIGHKGVTADGLFSLEEVECIGACCWPPRSRSTTISTTNSPTIRWTMFSQTTRPRPPQKGDADAQARIASR